jgi:opacity protein-like surface antigen
MKKLLILLTIVVSSQAVLAQGNFVISYPISFPMGDLKDYIGATSFRGISMEFNKRQKSNLDIGIEASWHVFYERVSEKAYTNETATITGIQYRYTNAVPLLAQFKYLKTTGSGKTMPYAGLGIGTTYVERATDLGLYRLTKNAWQFCLRPEIGIQMKAGYGASFMLGVKYYANFKAKDLDGQSYLSINIGFVFSGD